MIVTKLIPCENLCFSVDQSYITITSLLHHYYIITVVHRSHGTVPFVVLETVFALVGDFAALLAFGPFPVTRDLPCKLVQEVTKK